MSPPDSRAQLFALWGEISDLSAAEGLLAWDQETCMPERGQEGRAVVLSTLAGLRHAKLTAPELREALETCAAEAQPQSELEAQVREARREVERAAKVPAELAKALALAKSRGLVAWQRARAERDFSIFAPQLEELVRLKREEAAAIDPGSPPYDVLIEEYEPGAREAAIAEVFAVLRRELSPLVQAVADSGVEVDESPARGDFEPERQLAFGRRVAARMGFDFAAGRIDRAAHPFCSSFNAGDVRLTWRWEREDFRPALFGIMHEAGHGLYEQGLPERWARQPLGPAVSMAAHESQSRLWENLVGRSRAFWRWALPQAQQDLGLSKSIGVDQLWPALHTVKPTFIRVEADEGTYNLHIVARFEIERRLFGGELEVSDLPAAWDDTYEELLGIRPADAAEGVLQDIHWSMGAFGYFPTYALGNLVASQLFEAIERELGPQDQAFGRGDFQGLLDWLRSHVHDQGRLWSADELVQRSTGAPLSAEPFLRYVRRVTSEVYGLD